jgi:hypothetical protein
MHFTLYGNPITLTEAVARTLNPGRFSYDEDGVEMSRFLSNRLDNTESFLTNFLAMLISKELINAQDVDALFNNSNVKVEY